MTTRERHLIAQKLPAGYSLTRHAWDRMSGRSISPAALGQVLQFGRVVHARGARFFAIGRKEISRAARHGIDLQPLDGMIAICTAEGAIKTVYRNKDFRLLRQASRPQPRARRRTGAVRTTRRGH